MDRLYEKCPNCRIAFLVAMFIVFPAAGYVSWRTGVRWVELLGLVPLPGAIFIQLFSKQAQNGSARS